MTTKGELKVTTSLSHTLYSAEQVKTCELAAVVKYEISLYDLMERAGQVVFDKIREHYPECTRWVIFAGGGNNGGDAYVAARLAKEAGIEVVVFTVSSANAHACDAKQAQALWFKAGGSDNVVSDWDSKQGDVIVDGILGTGVSRDLNDNYVNVVKKINESDSPVVSIDIPSGIHADTGRLCGAAVKADMTVTFVGVKLGLVTNSGRGHAGHLVFDDLGIGSVFGNTAKSDTQLISFQRLGALPIRADNIHKGQCGKLLCIGSNKGMAGAIRLSGEAALRSGAGLVKVLCHESNAGSVINGRPELMVSSDINDLANLFEWADVVVVGPGLGQDEWALNVMTSLLWLIKTEPKPIIVDADALNIISGMPTPPKIKQCVVTPHVGEAARMLGCSVANVEANRYKSALELSKKFQASVVLKGAGTIVQNGEAAWVCEDGNPGMATAGMGDLLCGVLGALVANGLSLQQATCYAVCIHSRAADIVAYEKGPKGLLASDLFEPLRRLVNFDNAVSTNYKNTRTHR